MFLKRRRADDPDPPHWFRPPDERPRRQVAKFPRGSTHAEFQREREVSRLKCRR